jgi:hypothetical protein
LIWFGIVVMSMPVVTSFVYTSSPIVTARGYVAYGATVWFFCWLGILLAKGLRNPPVRLLGAFCVVLVLSSHFAWSTAHMWGWLGPLKSYFFGWDSGRPYVTCPWTDVLSATGFEKTPVFLGGDASFVEAGAYMIEPKVPVAPEKVRFWGACATRLLPFGLFGVLAAAYVNTGRKRLVVLVGVIAALMVSSGLSWKTFRATQVFREVQRAFPMPPSATLRYRVILSPGFVDKVAARKESGDELAVHLLFPGCSPGEGEIEIHVSAGSAELPVQWRDTGWIFRDPELALERMSSSREILVEAVNRAGKGVWVAGWLRRDSPSREFALVGTNGSLLDVPEVLPAVEIRLMRPNGRLKIAGF